MKKILSIILTFILVFSTAAFCLTARAEDDVLASGTFGDLNWTLSKDYLLTVGGEGSMDDFEEAPWDDAIQRELVALTTGFDSYEEGMQFLEEAEDNGDWRYIGLYMYYLRKSMDCFTVVLKDGVTSAKYYAIDDSSEEFVLPSTVEKVDGANIELEKLTVLGDEEIKGLTVPGVKGDYPQSLDEFHKENGLAVGLYYGATLLSRDFDNLVDQYVQAGGYSLEEAEKIRKEYSDGLALYYAAATGVKATTKEELFDAYVELVNVDLGTDFGSIDEIIEVGDVIDEENGIRNVSWTEALETAVFEKHGCTASDIVNLNPDSCKFTFTSVPIDEIGDEYVAAPWFTLRAPAGSAIEAIAEEKGINFVALPDCPNGEHHTVGDVVKENVVPPTCTEDGGYDRVLRCGACGLELSRNHISTDTIKHSHTVEVPETEATADAHGFTAGVYCEDCESWISGHEVIHNTNGESTIVKEATPTEDGEALITCSVCGESGLYTYSYQGKIENPDDSSMSIISRIRRAIRGIIDWFLRLIAWLG